MFPNLILTLSLATKLGITPFYIWFPEIIEGLNWINSFILLTWQKISPLMILSFFFNFHLMLLIASSSAFIGAYSGLNQTSLRKILSFSSISHLGWITRIIIKNRNFWFTYFLIYRFSRMILCIAFLKFSINQFSQIILLSSIKKKYIIFVNLLSLGGLPPLLGFFPKWIAFFLLKDSIPLLIVLISSRLITLYFYTRLCFNTFSLSLQNLLFIKKEKKNYRIKVFRILTIFSILGIFPLITLNL